MTLRRWTVALFYSSGCWLRWTVMNKILHTTEYLKQKLQTEENIYNWKNNVDVCIGKEREEVERVTER